VHAERDLVERQPRARTAVTVTGGTFTASLAATTVTSFVCK
jgi:hypothetical protein